VRTLLLLAAAPLLGACSSTTPLSIAITAGQEKDAFTADPAVTSVQIEVASLDGTIDLKTSAAPGGSFDLGDVDATQQVTITATGTDMNGTVVMKGSSLDGILLSSVESTIPIFVERVNQWARPPGGLAQSHVNGTACVEVDRYLLLTGGSPPTHTTGTAAPSQLDTYDLLALGGASTSSFSRVPATCVSIGEQMLIVDANGATWVDFDAETQTDVTLPSGVAAADLAGGQVIPAPNNSAGTARWFVVGGTRTGTPTSTVLEVDGDETLTGYTLNAPRAGAATVWVAGVGLVVAGGSATGDGIEILADGQTGFSLQPFMPDPTVGAAAVDDGQSGMYLFGGVSGEAPAPTRYIGSLSCSPTGPMCAPQPVSALALPALTNVSAYIVGPGNGDVVVVGSDVAAPGLDRTFYVGLGVPKVTELPLREPRKGATALAAPLGKLVTLAMLGGEHADGTPAKSVEMLFPVAGGP
jgi:hypothetical protein